MIATGERALPLELQCARAEDFAAAHRGRLLILPNAWDVASARVFAAEPACLAIGTTSAGIAAAHGYADGERLPFTVLLDLVRALARGVDRPLTVDLEAGYARDAATVRANVVALIEAGAVGLNLQDGVKRERHELIAVDAHAAGVAAARAAADESGLPMFINARTDVFVAATQTRNPLAEALARGAAYAAAGADGIFVPGLIDLQPLGVLAERLERPLNVLAAPGLPSVSELEGIGVARLSFGSAPMRALLGHLRGYAHDLLALREPTRLLAASAALTHVELDPTVALTAQQAGGRR